MFDDLKIPSEIGRIAKKVIDHELRPFCSSLIQFNSYCPTLTPQVTSRKKLPQCREHVFTQKRFQFMLAHCVKVSVSREENWVQILVGKCSKEKEGKKEDRMQRL